MSCDHGIPLQQKDGEQESSVRRVREGKTTPTSESVRSRIEFWSQFANVRLRKRSSLVMNASNAFEALVSVMKVEKVRQGLRGLAECGGVARPVAPGDMGGGGLRTGNCSRE